MGGSGIRGLAGKSGGALKKVRCEGVEFDYFVIGRIRKHIQLENVSDLMALVADTANLLKCAPELVFATTHQTTGTQAGRPSETCLQTGLAIDDCRNEENESAKANLSDNSPSLLGRKDRCCVAFAWSLARLVVLLCELPLSIAFRSETR